MAPIRRRSCRRKPIPLIKGFTTNPTLMREAGVKDYEAFAHDILAAVTDRPISFEVFADEFAEMERQAHKIAGWADNVYVKIPDHQYQARIVAGSDPPPVPFRCQAERYRHSESRAGAGRRCRRWQAGRRRWFRCLPEGLPIPALIPCRSWLRR